MQILKVGHAAKSRRDHQQPNVAVRNQILQLLRVKIQQITQPEGAPVGVVQQLPLRRLPVQYMDKVALRHQTVGDGQTDSVASADDDCLKRLLIRHFYRLLIFRAGRCPATGKFSSNLLSPVGRDPGTLAGHGPGNAEPAQHQL